MTVSAFDILRTHGGRIFHDNIRESRNMKRIPFAIDRAQRGALAEQLAEGLRKAIKSGVYRKGDRLPTVRDLVAYFGVSNRVPVAAFRILSDEGLVEAVPHRGCVVRELRSPVWEGHVLCIVPSGDFSYHIMTCVERIRRVLGENGYLFTQVTVSRLENGQLDLGSLDYTLQQPVDFAVLLGSSRRLALRLEKAKVPFIAHLYEDGESHKMLQCVYVNEFQKAYTALAACCRKRGDKRALCVVKREGEGAGLISAFGRVGIEAAEWCLYPKRQGRGRLEILRRAAFNAFESRLSEGCGWLPQVICFNDDYLATGAMAALSARGVRFPRDIRIATVVNAGNAPVFSGNYDRFESDPDENGSLISEAVLKRLSGRKLPSCLKLPVRFIQGC